MEVIEGMVERITFHNEESSYTVAKIKRQGKENLTTIVGNLPPLNIGESVKVTGNWEEHSDYGIQFLAENISITVPATLNGIEKYLGSGLIKGIGPKTAKKLVGEFGKDILDIIEYSPAKLTNIEGIGDKKAQSISKAFEEQKDIQEVMVFLQSYGISPTYAVKIYKQYKNDTIDAIKENPYRMADDIFGIGFKTADKIAEKLGMENDSLQRITSGIKYVLNKFSEDGHTFAPFNDLIEKSTEILEVDEKIIEQGLKILAEKEEIFIEKKQEEKAVYLAPFYYAEKGVAKRLHKMYAVPCEKMKTDPLSEISRIENKTNVKLAKAQKEAIEKIVNNNVLVITGGPGTGKTTTIKTIIRLMEKEGLKVVLAAPTGRAAKRMSEASGRTAKTIHRLLEFSPSSQGKSGFSINEDNPIKADVVIIDEISMVDILLMYNLLKAIKYGTRLIIVGDEDQLPSVGAGNVLREIIDCRLIPVVHLKEIFRQAKESMIVVNAHKINSGGSPILNMKGKDFYFETIEEAEDILNCIVKLCSKRIPSYGSFDRIDDIQVLTPMKRTKIGVNALNTELQKHLNPKSKYKEEKQYGSTLFRKGDKVMQIKNNYNKEVYNGDVGKITKIDNEEGELIVKYPEIKNYRDVVYEFHELEEIVLSYAVSVHKSQGSEYPVVVMPVSTQHFMLLQRNLLYTAITRAKKLVVLVGTKKALYIAIKNNKVAKRHTRLALRIKEEFEEMT